MQRAWYNAPFERFLNTANDDIVGALAIGQAGVTDAQLQAWREEVVLLKRELEPWPAGYLFLEFAIPRFGRRADAVVVLGPLIFVLEFKVGEQESKAADREQVWDYALDLKNFHETSHSIRIIPLLIPTQATATGEQLSPPDAQNVVLPVAISITEIRPTIAAALASAHDLAPIDVSSWQEGRYLPTPTIVEAAVALFRGHQVADLLRNDAGAQHLAATGSEVARIIRHAREAQTKAICFVTGVPGSGKTLIGLQAAADHNDAESTLRSVYLSGNQPLVSVLREALARDRIASGQTRRGEARSQAGLLIQIVHRFRDECLKDPGPPPEHVALFDEAQRAWDQKRTADFMRRIKKVPDFPYSEAEYLISCMDRFQDWAAIVCLVGGGQEINRGEAGIQAWIDPLRDRFRDWEIYISPQLVDPEYGSGQALGQLSGRSHVHWREALHLSVSMRSFRSERVSLLVKQVLDRDLPAARSTRAAVQDRYPIVLTRDVGRARQWLREHTRGSQRCGMVASSGAERLRPHAIDVRTPMDPVHWFLDGRDSIYSSQYLELPATEFHIQGLELDWAGVTWDGDLRSSAQGWGHFRFRGSRWNRVHKPDRQRYLVNVYRVLLTRARQGTVIVVPEGDDADPTRARGFYDPTFEYLQQVGFPTI